MKLLNKQFSPLYYYFLPLSLKYFPKHSVLKHPNRYSYFKMKENFYIHTK